jgi:hypothetical protein
VAHGEIFSELSAVKVVCFSPNDAVWRWTLPQAQVLDALKQRGDEIIYVYCDRAFSSFCMSMASLGVSFSDSATRKATICDRCVKHSKLARSRLGVAGRSIQSFLQPEDFDAANNISATRSRDELYDYVEESHPVGRWALYETIIQTKSISKNLSPEAERFYRSNFRNTLLSVRASKAMCEQFRPDIGISYHTAYAYNRAFQRVFEGRGVPVWFLNASMNVAEIDTHLVVARSDPERLFHRILDAWPKFENAACAEEDVASAADHLLALMAGGGFRYSVSMQRELVSVVDKLGIPRGKKVVAALLSSYDELLAADLAGFGWTTHNDVFSTQIEWLKWLFEFVRGRSDIHLVVRVHPREFAVGGMGGRSEHSYLLEALFAEKPDQVSINVPADGIALYDLLMEVDVALIAWSSAGMEAGMLGIPVVTYAGDVVLFPKSLAYNVTTRPQYAAAIDEALKAGWSLARARRFFRWAVLILVRSRIDLTNGAPTPTRQHRLEKLVRRGYRHLLRILIRKSPEEIVWVLRPRRLDDRARIYRLFDQALFSFLDDGAKKGIPNTDAESRQLVRELRRISDFITIRRGAAPAKLVSMISGPSAVRGTE